MSTREFITAQSLIDSTGTTLLGYLNVSTTAEVEAHPALPRAVGYANSRITNAIRAKYDPARVEMDESLHGTGVTLARLWLLQEVKGGEFTESDRDAKKSAEAYLTDIKEGTITLSYPADTRATVTSTARVVTVGESVPCEERTGISASAAYKSY